MIVAVAVMHHVVTVMSVVRHLIPKSLRILGNVKADMILRVVVTQEITNLVGGLTQQLPAWMKCVNVKNLNKLPPKV